MNNSSGSPPRRVLNPATCALYLWSAIALCASLPAQGTLFPPPQPAGGGDGSITWDVSVEPAIVAPGGEVSVVAKYDIPSSWYIYAPDHDPDDGPGLPMELAVEAAGLEPVGAPTFPEPKIKKDAILETVFTYRILEGKGSIARRYRVGAGVTGTVELNIGLKGQRCNPSVCLPVSYEKTIKLAVSGDPVDTPEAGATEPAGTVKPPRASPGNLLESGNLLDLDSVTTSAPGDDLLGGGNLLDPGAMPTAGEATGRSHAKWELALESNDVDRGGKVTVIAKYVIDPGWHIYAPDQGGFSLPTAISSESEMLKVAGKPEFPKPKVGYLEGLDEEQRWLEGEGKIRQSFILSPDAPTGPLTLSFTVDYQTCTEKTCDPLEQITRELEVTVSTKPPIVAAVDAPIAGGGENLAAQPLWLFILAMIGGGLFALAMPCTYPMIPITISYFTKQAEARHGRVLPLALAYGAGIIVIFNVIGILFAGVIQDFAFHWATNLFFCLAFVVFALSLFGLYEIRLPSRINLLTGKAAGTGGFLGVFLLGAVLVVSSFTCTAPVMGGLLILAVNDAGGGTDLARVSLGMTVFGATMAVPFVFLSLFPARVQSLPKSGEWMHVLKVSLGYLELAAALKFLSNVDISRGWNVLPRELFLLLWAGIFIMGSLYILNVYRLDGDSSGSIGPKRMLAGLCTLLLGLYFFWGSLGYQLDWVSSALAPPYSAQRLGAAAGGGAAKERQVAWTMIEDDIEGALARAREEGKPVLVNFTGHL